MRCEGGGGGKMWEGGQGVVKITRSLPVLSLKDVCCILVAC